MRGNGWTIWKVRASPRRAAWNGRCAVTSSPLETDAAGGRPMHAGHQVDQRGLAGAVGADERDDLALACSAKLTSLTAWMPPNVLAEPLALPGSVALMPRPSAGASGVAMRSTSVAIGQREQSAGQEEDQDDDDGAENGAVVVEEIGPEDLFQQR